MPLEVKDVSWSETEQFFKLNVPLKGSSAKNVDIFSTNLYIKVSYPPYFFEVALPSEIDDESSKATVSKEQVTFHLRKKEPHIWGQLHSSLQKDKVFMKNLRASAVEYKQKREEEKVKQKDENKDREKKFAVREQMKIDSIENEKVKELKNKETKTICEDMNEWGKKSAESLNSNTFKCQNEPAKGEKCFSSKSIISGNEESRGQNNPSIISGPQIVPEMSNLNHEKENNIPQPRVRGSIQVSFTPRMLATPARESKLPEEQLWLEKVSEFNRMKNTKNTDAADIEEMNPLWLKDKGNEFYKKGNWVAAINAYTSAILLDSKIPMLYANRAACHLSLKQYIECIQDCTCALELYNPPVPANALSRCRALIRRGTAFYNQEEYIDALRDYEEAITLEPKNDELKRDANKIRAIIQGEEVVPL